MNNTDIMRFHEKNIRYTQFRNILQNILPVFFKIIKVVRNKTEKLLNARWYSGSGYGTVIGLVEIW